MINLKTEWGEVKDLIPFFILNTYLNMANINKIRVSGTTYNIQDINAPKTVELTQAQYDALVTAGTVDPNTFYIITDASQADLSQYWTSAQTQSAITAATASKQDTLVSGTNIKTINNESILGSGNIEIEGGGKAVSAGTNISVTTGETADTINCTLPISKGSGTSNSLILGTGNGNTASGQYSIAVGGRNNSSSKYCSLVGGNENNVSNEFETAFGNSNNTNYASTTFGDSGNTLFSVGNGSNYLFRHNAFEIRQDGSIYIPDLSNGTSYRDRPMIKLQDQLGGGGNTNVVELTQAQYDALTTIDPDTIYVITDAQGGDLANYYTKTETNTLLGGKIDTSAITTSITSSSTDAQVPTAKAVYDIVGNIETLLSQI